MALKRQTKSLVNSSSFGALVFAVTLTFSCQSTVFAQESAVSPASPTNYANSSKPTMDQLRQALELCEDNPSDPKKRFQYAEMLRKMGKLRQASHEFMAVTDIDASYYMAYHMLAKHCKDAKILKEATGRLKHLKQSKPRELMLRVALSELYEAQENYYRASRELVDIVFLNAIPEKSKSGKNYRKMVHSRIQYLQAKSRDRHAEHHNGTHDSIAAQKDPPLPEESIKRGLAASSINKKENFGNAPLKR